jgi:hypothetical protein
MGHPSSFGHSGCPRYAVGVQVHTELWLYWGQATARATARSERRRTDATAPGRAIGEPLIADVVEELPEALLAITGAAFTLDGFAGSVGVMSPTPPPASRRRKRATAVLERLKLCFDVGPAMHSWVSEFTWLYALRDDAVHSKTRTDESYLHPSGLRVAGSAADYSAENARRAFTVVDEAITCCLQAPKGHAGLSDWCRQMLPRWQHLASQAHN